MTEKGGAWPWSHPAHSVGSVTWTLPTADTLQLGLSRSAQLEGGRERAKDGSWPSVFQSEKATLRGAKDYDRGEEAQQHEGESRKTDAVTSCHSSQGLVTVGIRKSPELETPT